MRADRSRFSRSPIAEGQNAADRGIDGGDQEGDLHALLTDNRRKWKRPAHVSEPYFGLVEG